MAVRVSSGEYERLEETIEVLFFPAKAAGIWRAATLCTRSIMQHEHNVEGTRADAAACPKVHNLGDWANIIPSGPEDSGGRRRTKTGA
jgi:hypothetical protein